MPESGQYEADPHVGEAPTAGALLDGRYRVLRKLGEGSMGDVYPVEHVALGRRDAVKLLKPELASSPDFVARFRREANAANRVRHRNIVGVHDFARLDDGSFMLVMEYIEGSSIEEQLQTSGPFSVARALPILEQVVDAMEQAHAAGVIHRDLKPGNLLLVTALDGTERVKVLDFGIAKIVAPDYVTIARTGQGEVMGTPLYMSPEQCVGGATDARTDLYAIGCIAFDMLVGEPPFSGSNAMRIMNAQMLEPPRRPSGCVPKAKIPAALDQIILRCLAKDPGARFQTASELLRALRAVDATAAAAAPSPTSEWNVATEVDGPTAGSRAASRAAHPGMVDTKVGPLLERLRERVTRANPAAFAEVEQLDVLHHELEACSRAVTDADRHVADAISATRTRQAEIMFSLSELRSEDQWDAKTSAQRDACVRELTQVTEALNAELEKLHDAQIIAAAQVSTADDGFRAGCQRLADQLRAIASDPDAFLDPIAVLEAVVARGA